ncbi:MAG: hypothetical protein RIT39_171, partial [Bacteroidota bacterium]
MNLRTLLNLSGISALALLLNSCGLMDQRSSTTTWKYGNADGLAFKSI